MATPRKPVRHGRERPAPEPLPTRTPSPSSTTPDTTAPTTTAPTGAPLVIRVVYEPHGSLAQVEVLLTYEDPANNFSENFTLSLRAADGPQRRDITILAPDPNRVWYRWSIRGFTSDGVVVESASISAGDPQVTIDGSLQAALLRK